MRLEPTRVGVLLLLLGATFAVTTALLQLRLAGGGTTPGAPLVAAVVPAGLAVAVLSAAWPVRRWNAGRRDRVVDPLRAARVLALAKASAFAGTVMTGGWLAVVGLALPLLGIPAQAERALLGGVLVLASLALSVAGLLAERWCMIPPEDDDETRRGGGTQPSPA